MKKRILVLCLSAITTLSAVAQERTIELSLEKAVEIALNDNPTIQVANLEIERQDYVRKETIGNHLPSLSANGTYTRNVLKQKLGGSIPIQGDDSYAAGATLSVPLFAPGVYATLKMNHQQMLAAVETARGSKISLANEVKKAYYNTLLAEQSLVVLYSSQKNITETVESIRASFKNGMASEYDLLTAEVQLSNLKPTIIQTESSIEIAKLMIKMLLGLPEDVKITLSGSLDNFVDTIYASGTALSTDLSENSDLKLLEIQERVLGAQFKTLRTQRMPTLAGFGSFNISGEESNFGSFMGGAAGPKMVWQKPLGFGVKLSVPIFSGLTNVNRERQVKNNIQQLQLQRAYAEEGKVVELKTSISNLMTAREQRDSNEKTVEQAQKAYKIAGVRFSAGTGTILELNSAELQLTQAKLNFTQASYNYLAAYADYEKIIGKE